MSIDLSEKVIGKLPIFSGSRISLSEYQILSPNGVQSTRHIVEHPQAVVVVPVTHESKFLLIRQFRTAAGRVLVEVPAGVLNVGEDPEVGAQRELREETGFRAGRLKKLFSGFPTPGFCTEYMHFYLATHLVWDPLDPDVDEIIEPFVVGINDIKEMIASDSINDVKTLLGL
ncbi:NUDIX hydrolase, partial [bacterium]|nr:NUDIX hydrolase [bacterium]